MRINRNHSLGKDEARRRVDGVSDELCGQYGLTAKWSGDEMKVDGSGIRASIRVGEDSVDVDVKLGFALSMMSGVIRSSIEDALEKYLA